MKPTANMDEKHVVVVSQPSEKDAKQSGLKKRIVLVTIGVSMLCACALSMGIYFGLKDQETVIQNHVYLNSNQGDVIPTDVTVTKDEECFSFENAAVVYDFSTGLTVYKSKQPDEQEYGCLVESFNMTTRESPRDFTSELWENKVLGWTDFEEFRVTSVWLNEEALGPKSHDLCADEEIKFIERVGSVGSDDGTGGIVDGEDEEDVDHNVDLVLSKTRVRRGWFKVRIRIRVRIGIRFGKRR